jgi:hypothetical protein
VVAAWADDLGSGRWSEKQAQEWREKTGWLVGLVEGKSQTIYPWDSWTKQYTNEPSLWFHDIFHRDGRPYRAEEVAYIREVTQNDVLFDGKDMGEWRQPKRLAGGQAGCVGRCEARSVCHYRRPGDPGERSPGPDV